MSLPIGRWVGVFFLVVSVFVFMAFYFLSGVNVDVSLGEGGGKVACPIDSPIAVTVTNYTFDDVVAVDLVLEGWRGGRNILVNDVYVFDALVAPFASKVKCFGDESLSVVRKRPEHSKQKWDTAESMMDDPKYREYLRSTAELRRKILDPSVSEEDRNRAVLRSLDLQSNFNDYARSLRENKAVRVDVSAALGEMHEYMRKSEGVEVSVKSYYPHF